jgi:UDPglucose--hexose-1-phosphate uridylyltransferase
MPELRLNLITREWVIIAKERCKKPEDCIITKDKKRRPEYVETCPFCPGNESKTPDESYRIGDDRGWRVRVVPNKFAVLLKEGDRIRTNSGIKKCVNGVGIHEVIVETPLHNLTTATIPDEQLRDVIQTYRERFIEIYRDPRVEHVIIFRNNGPTSGTTIEHPHSQIVGTPITPLQIRNRIEGYMKFFDENGECLMCRTIEEELKDNSRILLNTEHFVSFVPYAALSAFHVWIFPKRHSGSFSAIRQDEIWDLTINLKTTMAKLYYGLDCPDFNYVIRSGKPGNADSEFIHWYISIVPRVTMASGFELGSGIYINPILPEVSAEFLRNVKIPHT